MDLVKFSDYDLFGYFASGIVTLGDRRRSRRHQACGRRRLKLRPWRVRSHYCLCPGSDHGVGSDIVFRPATRAKTSGHTERGPVDEPAKGFDWKAWLLSGYLEPLPMGVKTAALARAGLAGSVEGAGETVFWKAWPVIKRDALPYDLHFGRDFAFRPQGEKARYGGPRTLTECLVNDLTFQGVVKDIAAVIITGDFMTAGDWSAAPVNAALAEFDALHKALDLTPQQIIAVPGNHDIVRFLTDRLSAKDAATSKESEAALISDAVDAQVDMKHEQPFREFVAKLTGRHEKASFNYVRRIELNDVDLLVCALNSCVISGKTNLIQYRYVGDGKAAIKQLGQEELRRPTYRFLALHHHLLPVAAIEYPSSGGVSLTLDASEILPDGQRAGVNVVLHGHQHQPKVTEYRAIQLNRERESADENLKSLYVVANGSASVNSDNNHRIPPGYVNTYCLFKLTAEKIELVVREFRSDGGRVESQLDQALDSKPGTPTKATNPA